jgi:glutathione S-transferase
MTMGYVALAPDVAKHPATAEWYARVIARPAWADVASRERALFQARMPAA